jgi:tRNA threonylcarbamoyladenosine biosynthesis protein TsaE
MKKKIIIPGLEELSGAAEEFLKQAGHIPVVAFAGELGAGKTTFIRALCSLLGVTREVNSPTFALVNEYFTGNGESVYHIDLYRIEDPAELFDLGYEEYFYSGRRCLIEWPEKASHLIPEDALMVQITVLEDGSRELVFELPETGSS